jgi:hypothetical protein
MAGERPGRNPDYEDRILLLVHTTMRNVPATLLLVSVAVLASGAVGAQSDTSANTSVQLAADRVVNELSQIAHGTGHGEAGAAPASILPTAFFPNRAGFGVR